MATSILLFLFSWMVGWPHPFPLFFFKGWGDGHLQSYYGSSRGRGEEMAHSIFTVLPQGDVAYSISFFLLKLIYLLLFALN